MTQTDFITQSLIAYVAAHDSDVDIHEGELHFSEYSKDKQAALLERHAEEAKERWLLLPADLRPPVVAPVVTEYIPNNHLWPLYAKALYLDWVNRSHCREDLAARYDVTVEAVDAIIAVGRLVNEDKFYV